MWHIYQVVFKACSPTHIGYKQINNLKTTRYYIMGKQLWGALTANFTRYFFDKPTSDNYRNMGEFVKESIKTTYFFPAIVSSKDKSKNGIEVDNYEVFLPTYRESGLYYGDITCEEFESLFIKSYVSTAIDIKSYTAEDESLHEFEYINNKVFLDSNEKLYDVYFFGYIFVNDDPIRVTYSLDIDIKCEEGSIEFCYNNKNLKFDEIYDLIQVGGERVYGYGVLKLENIRKIEENDEIFERYRVYFDSNNKIAIKLENDVPIFTHLEIDSNVLNLISNEKIKSYKGEIESFSGREWDTKGSGRKISQLKTAFKPGTKFYFDSEIECLIDDYGILKIKLS